MGTRRGAQRQAESDAFEAANPFLKRVETKLEVELADIDEWGGGSSSEAWDWCHEDTIPVPKVTQDGQEVDSHNHVEFGPEPGLSTTYRIYTPIGNLDAEDEYDGADISMSEYGFGVISESDFPEESESMGAYALNDEETLEFELRAFAMERELVPEGEPVDQGGVSFEIEYMVLGGSGQVGLALFDYNCEEEEGAGDVDVMSGLLSTGDSGSFMANAAEGTLFDEAIIYVDGSIQVAITGISVVTNFEGGLIAT